MRPRPAVKPSNSQREDSQSQPFSKPADFQITKPWTALSATSSPGARALQFHTSATPHASLSTTSSAVRDAASHGRGASRVVSESFGRSRTRPLHLSSLLFFSTTTSPSLFFYCLRFCILLAASGTRPVFTFYTHHIRLPILEACWGQPWRPL
jgi:hypothetical protein